MFNSYETEAFDQDIITTTKVLALALEQRCLISRGSTMADGDAEVSKAATKAAAAAARKVIEKGLLSKLNKYI